MNDHIRYWASGRIDRFEAIKFFWSLLKRTFLGDDDADEALPVSFPDVREGPEVDIESWTSSRISWKKRSLWLANRDRSTTLLLSFCKSSPSVFLKKMGQTWPLFHLFLSLKTHITNFTTKTYVKKYLSRIRCRDSNPQPSDRESLPITTRPGLLPNVVILFPLAIASRLSKFHP